MDPYFLRGEMTPEQVNFLFEWEEGKTVYTQKTIEGTVSGKLFDLPAGPVSIALGINGREDRINDVPGEITRAGNAWGSSARSEEHTSELQSLMRISYAVFCLKKKTKQRRSHTQ